LKPAANPPREAWRRKPTESASSLKMHRQKEITNQKAEGRPGRLGHTREAKLSQIESSKVIPGQKSNFARSILKEARTPGGRGAGRRRSPQFRSHPEDKGHIGQNRRGMETGHRRPVQPRRPAHAREPKAAISDQPHHLSASLIFLPLIKGKVGGLGHSSHLIGGI
jgi:hypothetical protein